MSVRGNAQRVVALWPGALYGLVVLVHLTLLLLRAPASEFTQYMLMPPLIAFVLLNCRTVRSRLVQFALLALLLSWLGDSLPFLAPKEWEFLTRMAFYLPVGILWVLTFWPFRARSILQTRPQLMAPFSIALVGLIAVCVQGAGRLWPLLTLYGLLLGLTAALSTGLNARTAWAAVLMIVTSGVMAVSLFNPEYAVPFADVVAMASYCASQALFALGVLEQSRQGRPLLVLPRPREATSAAGRAHS